MFTQIKKNRKGVSPIIGYVLLVTFVIVLGVVIYNWMRTYVPQQDLECPDGTSLFIQDYVYECTENTLEITLKNNGKFNIGGYFIYASTTPEQELATRDLTTYFSENFSILSPTGVKLTGEFNSLVPNQEEVELFNLTSFTDTIYSIEIIPIRWQREGRVNRIVSCRESKIREVISCS
jgi:flagellin-like protein